MKTNHYMMMINHEFPKGIRSYNGSHFKNWHMAKIIKHALPQTPIWVSQSQGKAERMNLNIKNKLVKVMKETGVNWMDDLWLVLMGIRHSINRVTGYTPFKLQHGRTFPHPWGSVGPATTCNPKVIYKMANHLSTSLSQMIALAEKPFHCRNTPALEGDQKEVVIAKVDRTAQSSHQDWQGSAFRRKRKQLVPSFPVCQGYRHPRRWQRLYEDR